MFRSQDVIAQRYQLKRLIDNGDVLQSWLAHDRPRGNPTVVSICMATDSDQQAAFQAVAEAACGIDCPFVERGHDRGDSGGYSFLVTDYLHGHSLAAELAESHLGPRRVLSLAHSVASGLEAIHRAGRVHGQLAPPLLFLSSIPRDVYCRILTPMRHWLGQESDSAYREPNLSRRPLEGLDRRVDLWAFAVIIYRCLTGHLPYESAAGESAGEWTEAARSGRFRPIRGDSAPTLNSWFFTAFHPDPESRFTSALQMVSYLQRILGSNPAQLVS